MPDQAAKTSSRWTLISGARYPRISLRIQLISSSEGIGSLVISVGLSVVPAIVFPCQGRKKITRPSEVDVLARRTRLAFLNAQAALETLPTVIDLMAEELKWDERRKQTEWDDSVKFLMTMGLDKTRLGISRKDVENGKL